MSSVVPFQEVMDLLEGNDFHENLATCANSLSIVLH